MTPERWRQIEEVCELALLRGAHERSAFLDTACGGDEEMRREIESLLGHAEPAESFLEASGMAVLAQTMARDRTGSMIGLRIGAYEILSFLGAGGMGEVYSARDTRLARLVALKILPGAVANDSERKRRFLQEAKAASALNHPHIVTLHDVGSEGGVDFLIMEYVEGKTLEKLIPESGLNLRQALQYAIDIADAFAKAHATGIVHRDLKPSNIMVTDDGSVKVLDFGIAKLIDIPDAGESAATATSEGTQGGAILGTAAYMSPEQAKAKQIDARSDIFSFGALLYEMVTGHKAFPGDSKLSSISAILLDEPRPAGQLVKSLPRELDGIIVRCLRKNPEHRFQTMRDLKVALEELKAKLAPQQRLGRRVAWAAALLVAIAAGATVWFARLTTDAPEAALTPVPLITYPGMASEPSFSPDGSQIAFFWEGEKQDNQDIYVKRIGAAGPPQRLTTDPRSEFDPTWSPDGRFIAFRRVIAGGKTEVLIIPATGGTERKVGEAFHRGFLDDINAAAGMAWSPDSKWLVLPDQAVPKGPVALFLLSIETGEKHRLTSPPPGLAGDATPAFSPDGRTLVFSRSIYPMTAILSDLYVLALSHGLKPVGEARRITFGNHAAAGPAWTPDGREIIYSCGAFSSQPELWRIAVSGSFGRPAQPRRLASLGVGVFGPAISPRTHRMVYHHLSFRRSIRRVALPRTPRPLDATGLTPVSKTTAVISSTRDDYSPQFSPDGNYVAFVSARSGTTEIWKSNTDGSNPVQLTSFGGPDTSAPSWSPDGRRIAFASYSEGGYDIWVVGANGGRPQRMTTDPANDVNPIWSRDGRWIYFESARSGETQIWKMPAHGGEAVQVSRNGGGVPRESPDGKFIYYASCPALWRIPAEGGPATNVLDPLPTFGNLAIVNDGLYLIPPRGRFLSSSIQFLSFSTNKIRNVATLENFRDLGEASGLTVSPDRRSILYTQIDQFSIELMMVENFH